MLADLKTHLHTSVYYELFKYLADIVETISSSLDGFKRVMPLLQSSDKVKKLTYAVCEMMARDIRPISIFNHVNFLNVLKEVEPYFVVPCHSTITRNTDDLYTSEKWQVMGVVANVVFVRCTTDM